MRTYLSRLRRPSKRSWFESVSVRPVSNDLGLDRGRPIDRYYIEKFLSESRDLIRGDVLEVGDSTYTRKFAGTGLTRALTLHVKQDSGADVIANLSTGEGIRDGVADTFIFTQTLPFIYDSREGVKNALRLLRSGGKLLVTAPGITQISAGDMKSWGQFWSFTDLSMRKLFEEFVPADRIQVRTHGNVKAAVALMLGLASHEVDAKELDYHDPNYQVTISAVVTKP